MSLGVSGSGIGLNLAKEMVILHGGTIRVESESGNGAEFIVALPTKFKEELVIAEDKAPKLPNEETPELIAMEPKSEEKPVILLIEDNFDFRSFMKESLEENYIVHEAQDGIEGFDMIHKIIPDLIISDVMMPRMDGLELCRKLKGDIRTSHIPLILLTARTADEDKIKGLEIGADDYITKPFNMDLLLLRIQNAMEKRKEIQQQFQKNVSIETTEVEVPSMEES
ncbi:MAG: response regulator [Chloroflexia bacterium]|nr:response regulator [Chloroflexia bacterium]